MAQRILLGFDALDKYSKEILAKHAKKRSLSFLQKMPSLIIPLPLDFDSEFNPDPYERINRGKTPSPRYPMNTESGKKVHLRPFTASGHCFSEVCEKEKRELKRLTKPRCASADRRRPWRSEVQSIPDLDTLCHVGHSGPILSSLGAPFTGSPRDVLEDSGTTERPEVSACGADMRPSPLPDTLGCSRSENMTEHPPRGNIQKAAAVSLCLEDEMKKSDVKIITVKQKRVSAHVQNVSETHPIIYNSPITSLSDFQRNLITRSKYFSSSQGPEGQSFSPLQQNKMTSSDFLRRRRLGLQDATRKNKAFSGSSSDNTKVILRYLSADGTKQRVEMATDGNVATKKQVDNPTNRKNFVQDTKIINISPTMQRKAEEFGVGPVINGMNPMMAIDHGPHPHGRSHQGTRLFYPNSTRTSTSPTPRPSSVKDVHNWSYISISKPLSPPEEPPEPLQMTDLCPPASPDLVQDNVLPTYEMPPMIFAAKSVTLETRHGKPGSSPVETTIGTFLGSERSQNESNKEGGETVESDSESDENQAPPETELEGTSSKDESNEQTQKSFSLPSTSPVINIPTATAESAE